VSGVPGAAPPSTVAPLDALFDSRRSQTPYVTYAFLGLCLLVTLPTLAFPRLYDVFGGIEPRRYPWQVFTAAFEHGWPGFHGAIHLALNTFLILECGRPCERLLGSRAFLTLCLLSLLANAAVLSLTEGVNGSSLVIWSWGPPLFVALRWARRSDPAVTHRGSFARVRGVLVLMYGVIVVAMAALPYLFGWRGNPLVALAIGNLYHGVATAVGVGFALVAAGHIHKRLATPGTA
jgi:membrane associated rhomboid family serine protease